MSKHRYNETARLDRLREKLAEELRVLDRLETSLREWKPTDKRGWTSYDYKTFQGSSKAAIHEAIYDVKSKIADIKRQIHEAEQRDGLTDDEILVY